MMPYNYTLIMSQIKQQHSLY